MSGARPSGFSASRIAPGSSQSSTSTLPPSKSVVMRSSGIRPAPSFAGEGSRPPRPGHCGVGRITPSGPRRSGAVCFGSGAPGASAMVTPCGQSAGAIAT